MRTDLNSFCVGIETSIRDAIACMDKSRCGIILVVSSERKLEGTITDGDVRRMILAKVDLDESVSLALARNKGIRPHPIVIREDADPADCLHVLQENHLMHLPVLDSADSVVGLVTLDEFISDTSERIQAVVMAGGEGKRLHPLTENTPKPMLEVGDRPLLEIIIDQLKDFGVGRVHLATHHNRDKITNHFGDGKEFGIDIDYVAEDRPLGTAGALGLMETPDQTVLVVNGDILTEMDFKAMLAFHREQQSTMTVAVREYDLQLPYGVVECDGPKVRELTEKPVYRYFVNAGIYLLEPDVYSHIPSVEQFDMTDLIQALLDADLPVSSFPIREYWSDIGQYEDYEKARNWVKGDKD